jgi:arginine/ornithine transport system permease protein
MLLLLLFGRQTLLNAFGQRTGSWDYVEIDAFLAGALTTGFIFGAYIAESFGGAHGSIPPGQFEAATAIGMTHGMALRRLILPSALRRCLPMLGNEAIFLLHGSAIASMLTVIDILGAGRKLNAQYYLAFEGFIAATLIYMVLVWGITLILARVERRTMRHLQPIPT